MPGVLPLMDRKQPSRRIDAPEPCHVAMRLVKGGPVVAARIVRRMGMLIGEINGAPGDVERIWQSGERIDEARYNDLLANAPAAPEVAIDWRSRDYPF